MTGRLKQRRWQTPDGQNRTVVELEVDELGPSLRFATAKVNRVKRGTNGDNGFGRSAARPNSDDRSGELVGAAAATSRTGGTDDPWAVNGAGSFGGGTGNDDPQF